MLSGKITLRPITFQRVLESVEAAEKLGLDYVLTRKQVLKRIGSHKHWESKYVLEVINPLEAQEVELDGK